MRVSYLFISVTLLAVCLRAQQPMTPNQLGTAPLTGEGETARKNTVIYGMTSATTFDDNAQSITTTVSNLTSSIEPNVSVSIDRSRSNALFYYSPTYTYSSNVAAYNSVAEAAATNLQYRLSPRLSIQVKDAFSLTNNAFENLHAAGNLPTLGILDRPNASVLGANVRSESNLASADSIYRLGPHSSVGIGGTFLTLQYRYPNVGGNGAPTNFRTWSGHAFYSQQLTPRYSFSIEYSAQNFSSQGLYSTLTHSVLGFWTISLHKKIELSMFGGPQLSQFNDSPSVLNTNVLGKQSSTGFSGGSTLTWQGEHNGLNISFVQRVSDSGAAGGAAVHTKTVTLGLQRQLTSRVTAALFANYVSNEQLDPLAVLPNFSSVSGGGTISRMLTPHLSVSLSAFRQTFLGNIPQLIGQPDHNAATVSISYSFSRPVGR